jgi:diacylglycerol O-acyltransferase / wax synthase
MVPRRDRLSAVDASFLVQEHEASHMHIGALAIFEDRPPTQAELIEHVESRLHLVPRYRQKLAESPLGTGRPFWVDDPCLNLYYHVRHTALPRPGDERKLRELAGRVFSQRLDRSKPLWELWLVEGLEPEEGDEAERFALISKTHHSMVDGVAGVDIATVLFDLEREPKQVTEPPETWEPHPEPSTVDLLAQNAVDAARRPLSLLGEALDAVRHPDRSVGQLVEALEAVGEVAWAGLDPAPETPVNVPIGPHRRLCWVRARLDDFKRVKNVFGGTVNDVVLAVVTGALRRWLRTRGVRTEGVELRALVPVSIRAQDQHGELGNKLAAMRGPLPVYIDDPVERLAAVREEMQGLKESRQALGAEVIAALESFAPPTLLAQASRLNFSTRLFNLIVTNVPGPQLPLYLLGRELLEIIPIAFLPDDHAIAIAIMSYNGRVDFGLLADYDALPDVDELGLLVEASLGELLAAAAERAAEDREPAEKTTARAGDGRRARPSGGNRDGSSDGAASRRRRARSGSRDGSAWPDGRAERLRRARGGR